MATGIVLSAAQTLFAALQCKELREVCSIFGYESELDELQRTVTTIKAVLLDAESKQQELTHEGRDWIESLKDAVYDVDDLLDEFRTMALQRHQMRHAKVSKKVRRFFSRSNKFLVAFNTSHDIKKIKDKLNNIAKNRSNFGFGDTYEPVKRRDDTSSYVREESIIGRETDKEAIVGMLLSENEENISFVSIVGIGGLGKTALAQLVFNDDRIRSAFADLMIWVCVSEDFTMKGILSKILERDGLELEGLQREVRQKIVGKKYLLVLDDVWNENRNEWLMLRDFLHLGGKGSRVLVTSRSKQVARVIENNSMHWIQGLSDQNSWNLFKTMAFENGKEPQDSKLVELGKEIVKKCANVPLSIRVIGSLLYGQEKSKWLSFKSVDLSKMGEGEAGILQILKFSYYHLTPSLKCCFSYCALFPKDYIMDKRFLIDLWMAQGCLDSGLQDGRSIEDVGEEYFSYLLQRCFVQDFNKDMYDEIFLCKMHDLIHDLAQEVAGKEFSLVNTIPMDGKIRHISLDDINLVLFSQSSSLDKMKNLRTILNLNKRVMRSHLGDVTNILVQCRHSRVLSLDNLHIKVIPNTLSKFLHLRYLDLSENQVKILPKFITKLLNLQVMKLMNCRELKELPKDLAKLVNLRQLDIWGCALLPHMPVRLDRLTCLHTLTMFVLGRGSSNQVQMGQLQDLKRLVKLRGELKIVVKKGHSYNATNAEGGYLVNMSHIKDLYIEEACDEGLLEVLEPHCNVRSIEIRGYEDSKLPNWAATLGSSLPLLASLYLQSFPRLQHLPILSQLRHLKSLSLCSMDSVEHIEDDNDEVASLYQQCSTNADLTFFKSLERLILIGLPKLKGWWRDDMLWSMKQPCGQDDVPSFPRLHELRIECCPSMTSFPECPDLDHVSQYRVNGPESGIKSEITNGSQTADVGAASSSNSNNNHLGGFDLDRLTIDNIEIMSSVLRESLRVNSLHLQLSENERFSDARVEHLANDLQHLRIERCWNLVLEEDGDGMMPWKALHVLSSLVLWGLPKLVNLPKGFQHLTSLQSLRICYCNNLEALPEWLDRLTSLQYFHLSNCQNIKSLPEAIQRLPSLSQLEIRGCGDDLTKRCKEPDGEDCPKIRHIPRRTIEK